MQLMQLRISSVKLKTSVSVSANEHDSRRLLNSPNPFNQEKTFINVISYLAHFNPKRF
jgi:hypothetical protein